jgi:3-hydroxybutyrate dehydrogenase
VHSCCSTFPLIKTFPSFIIKNLISSASSSSFQVSSSGKAVLVTGCENPLAWYLCKKLDEIGFAVFAGFKNVAENADAELLTEECSARVRLVQIDASSDSQVNEVLRLFFLFLQFLSIPQMHEAAKFIEDSLPDGANGLWGLLHCDQWNAIGELEWIPPAVLKKSLEVNVAGTVRITQIFLPLIRRGKGRVVYLSSAMAKIYNPVRGIQTAISNAIESLALCLRSEMRRHGVQVIVVAAGEFASGTAWLDNEELCDQARTMWKNMNDSLRFEIVDEKYFEFTIRQLERFTKVTVDLTPAIHTLIDAVQKTFPLSRYTPITFEEKLKTLVADYMPYAIYDVIYN